MKVVEVSEGIFRIESTLGVRRICQWVCRGSDRLLLVDTGIHGSVADVIEPALGELGLELKDLTDVVISHADVDHYGGNGELRARGVTAEIACHPIDRPLIESWNTIADERYLWYKRFGLAYDDATLAWLHDAAGQDTAVDSTIQGGDSIDLGGFVLEVLDLPGHTAGHIGLWHSSSGTAIAVDSVLEYGLYDVEGNLISPPPYVTLDGYRKTISKLRSLGAQRLETAHYPPVEGQAVEDFLDASYAFTDRLDASCTRQLAEQPRSLPELASRIDAEIGPFSEMAVELSRSIHSHLSQMESEGLARQDESAGGQPAWATT
jgi:glyoxylase-like metal-dependent hydrolase (beta-lactamase superfamily II)